MKQEIYLRTALFADSIAWSISLIMVLLNLYLLLNNPGDLRTTVVRVIATLFGLVMFTLSSIFGWKIAAAIHKMYKEKQDEIKSRYND